MPLSLLPVRAQTAVTGPAMKQWLCRGLVGLFCFVIFETCVSGLLGRVRIFFQDTCYRSLGVTAPVWCDVYLCVSALEQKDGEAGD